MYMYIAHYQIAYVHVRMYKYCHFFVLYYNDCIHMLNLLTPQNMIKIAETKNTHTQTV